MLSPSMPAENMYLDNTPVDDSQGSVEYDSLRCNLINKLSECTWPSNAVLIQIPQVPENLLDADVARNRGYFAYPPQSLLYVAAALRQQGITPRIVDLNYLLLRAAQDNHSDLEAVWKNAIDDAVAAASSLPMIGISYMFGLNRHIFERTCRYVRENHPASWLLAGGVAASSEAEELVQTKMVDFVLAHEAETTIPSFFDFWKNHDLDLPPNVSFLDTADDVMRTEEQKGGDLNLDIRREYELIPIKDYCLAGSLSNFSRMNGLDIPFATIQSRRGCRARCAFCGVRGFNGRGVRVRPVDDVIDEMAFLYENYQIRHFDWLDDDFLFNGKMAVELLEKMARRMPDITWGANNGLIAAAFDDRIMNAAEKSGLIGFRIGLESGNESVLKKVRKPINLQQLADFSKRVEKYPGVFVGVNLILGFPGERFHQMVDTFRVATQAGLDWNNFYMYQPIKDTDLYTAWGGLGSGNETSGIGKENNTFNLNPVRGGAFSDAPQDHILSGYDVFSLPPDLEPARKQVNEIWFTFNYTSNFICLPALKTESGKRLQNAVKWMEVLSKAYPEDAAMKAVLYYLVRRLNDRPLLEQEQLQSDAWNKFKASPYWQRRDKQFEFSTFLDNAVPRPAPVVSDILGQGFSYNTGQL